MKGKKKRAGKILEGKKGTRFLIKEEEGLGSNDISPPKEKDG